MERHTLVLRYCHPRYHPKREGSTTPGGGLPGVVAGGALMNLPARGHRVQRLGR